MKKDPMIRGHVLSEFCEKGLSYSIHGEDNRKVSIEEVFNDTSFSFSNQDLIKINILQELWIQEVLQKEDGSYILLYDSIYDLDRFQRACLEIPHHSIEQMTLKSRGIVTKKSFMIHYNLFNEMIPVTIYERHGNYVITSEETYVLTKNQYDALELAEAINKEETVEERILGLGRLKLLVNNLDVVLDGYLMRNEYVAPDEITLDIEETENGIIFKPRTGILPEMEEKEFAEKENYRNVLSFSDGLKRKRMVLSPEQKQKVEKIKSTPPVTGDDIARFHENPMPFIPEDISIDPEEFSERVKGFRKIVYKAVPFVRTKEGEKGWFEIEIGGKLKDPISGEEIEMTPEEIEKISKEAESANREYVPLGNGFVKIDEEMKDFVKKVKTNNIKNGDKVKNVNHILDIFTNTENLEYTEGIEGHVEKKSLELRPIPSAITATLMQHQQEGFSWLYENVHVPRGSLLADDMGLGKTMQIIALFAALDETDDFKPTLIVLPKALLENWQSEINKFMATPIAMYFHIGSERIREVKAIQNMQIVFTTYETLSRDQLLLGKIKWKTIVLDEAQKIKNTTTYVTNAAKAMNSKRRIALTGTPVENNLTELWSIIDFVQPGLMGSLKEFKQTYQLPIEKEENQDAAVRLHEKLSPVLLRRNKTDILKDLPQKEEIYIECQLSGVQKNLYKELIYQREEDKGRTLAIIQNLLMLCSHPALLGEELMDMGSIENIDKLEKTMSVLKQINDANEKVILFTRYKKMQTILSQMIYKYFGRKPMIINGEVTNNRAGMIDQFNVSEGFNAIVLSPKAAGVGLNITSANHVIHYTREWNPAIENQATDRVYRIGQKKDVKVYYPIVRYGNDGITVEEKLDELLMEKRKLFENTIIPTKKLQIEAKDFESILSRDIL